MGRQASALMAVQARLLPGCPAPPPKKFVSLPTHPFYPLPSAQLTVSASRHAHGNLSPGNFGNAAWISCFQTILDYVWLNKRIHTLLFAAFGYFAPHRREVYLVGEDLRVSFSPFSLDCCVLSIEVWSLVCNLVCMSS